MTNHSVRDIATDRNLWDEYVDPNAESPEDFDTMTADEKVRMIINIWPEDIADWDEEALAIREALPNAGIHQEIFVVYKRISDDCGGYVWVVHETHHGDYPEHLASALARHPDTLRVVRYALDHLP